MRGGAPLRYNSDYTQKTYESIKPLKFYVPPKWPQQDGNVQLPLRIIREHSGGIRTSWARGEERASGRSA
jgi:hypothetical protein